jgi:hypothetical protein
LDGINDTAKLNQEPVAHCFNETAPVVGDGRLDNLVEMAIEFYPRAFFVCARVPSSSAPISREYPTTSAASIAASLL